MGQKQFGLRLFLIFGTEDLRSRCRRHVGRLTIRQQIVMALKVLSKSQRATGEACSTKSIKRERKHECVWIFDRPVFPFSGLAENRALVSGSEVETQQVGTRPHWQLQVRC